MTATGSAHDRDHAAVASGDRSLVVIMACTLSAWLAIGLRIPIGSVSLMHDNPVFHDLCAYRAYRGFFFELAYWRLASGIEVDFVVDDLAVAIEAKATGRVHAEHLRGLRELAAEHPVRRRVVISLDERARRTDDGIEILPWRQFAEDLWRDDLSVA